MASLRDIKRKIGAVKKTQQITKAMNMVAAAKLRGAQEKMERFKPYSQKFREVLTSLAGRVEPDIHPLLVSREETKKVALILITSDRGLCGSYNTNLNNRALKWMEERKNQGQEVSLIAIGRKGRDFFRRRKYTITRELVDQMGNYDYTVAHGVAQGVIQSFLAEEYDEVHILYSEFINVGIQKPFLMQLLPISTEEMRGEEIQPEVGYPEKGDMEYLCEPSAETLMIELLPKHIDVQLLGALQEAVAGEHAARMTAMDNAQSNCKDMIENLTLAYNKARQAAITTELMDIVGGAEALKG